LIVKKQYLHQRIWLLLLLENCGGEVGLLDNDVRHGGKALVIGTYFFLLRARGIAVKAAVSKYTGDASKD